MHMSIIIVINYPLSKQLVFMITVRYRHTYTYKIRNWYLDTRNHSLTFILSLDICTDSVTIFHSSTLSSILGKTLISA